MRISTSVALLTVLLCCMSAIKVNGQGACKDTNVYCPFYFQYGLCEIYKEQLTLTCPKSCSFCPTGPQWGEWGPWESCPAACGTTGTQARNRICSNGNTCTGSATQTRPCSGPTCPPVAAWSKWGTWGDCQAACGTSGTQDRTRTCQNGNTCPGKDTDSRPCVGPTCPPEWSNWGTWGTCQAACGTMGTQERTRTCENGNSCPGSDTGTQPCTGPTCAPEWTQWGNWEACEGACGTTGNQKKRRTCQNGDTCEGFNTMSRSCVTPTCSPVVKWSSWENWSTCNAPCDATSTQERSRVCQNGNSCPGLDVEVQDCAGPTCPPGQVWDAWSVCSQSCGIGYQTRTRSCAAACTEYGGQQCPQVADCSCTGPLCSNTGSCGDALGTVCLQIKAANTCLYPNYVEYFKTNCKKSCGYCGPCVCDAAWSDWKPWTACSVTCGAGTRWRYRDCNKVAGCGDEYFESGPCNTGVCPVWSSWSSWTSCDCADLKRSRSRTCPISNACPGESSTTEDCVPVGCPEWTAWGGWSNCDATCGSGKQKRTRSCMNGDSCIGSSIEHKDCVAGTCPAWSNWSAWATCDQTCGGGKQMRTRTCVNGPGCAGKKRNAKACNTKACPTWSLWQPWSDCSTTCGAGKRTRTRTCNNAPGCTGPNEQEEDCNERLCPSWTTWTPWSNCDKTCGQGSRKRDRVCNNGPCSGSASDTETCTAAGDCPTWTPWTSWGACDQTCGGGEQTRSRTCNNGPCNGPNSEKKQCNTHVCPAWSPWGTWGTCSATCGGGKRTRTRTCNNGPGCSGSNNDEENCNTNVCPSWTAWTSWGACDQTCGGGEQTRSRTCNNGPCNGADSEKKQCNTHVCPAWSPWGTWGTCDATCGGGKRTRTRTCNNGPGCSGSNNDEGNCNSNACPSWTGWTNWGTCDKSCGPGEQTRSRTCNNGPCTSGSASDKRDCNLGTCPANWGQWGQWSSCPVTCGRGSQSRSRTCIGSGSCEGESSELKTCLNGPVCPCVCSGCTNNPSFDSYCKQPSSKPFCTEGGFTAWFRENCPATCGTCQCTCGTWSDWSNWGGCTPTCGDGQRTRTRTCPAQTSCDGSTTEYEPCTNPVTCAASWSEWGGWSQCTGQCGSTGTQTRTRVCVPSSACSGSASQQQSCQPPCTGWGHWGPCSRSCGQGTRIKRQCQGCKPEYDDCDVIECPKLSCTGQFRRYSVNNHSCCSGQVGSCGTSSNDGRIVNGRDAKARQWPWMVFLIFNNNLCGGMVISNFWVLSAAHCFNGVQPSAISAKFGTLLFNENSPNVQVRSVSQVIIHPSYTFPKHDVALLRLSQAVNIGTYVRPICLPHGETALVGNMCVAAGWGKLAENAGTPNTLMEVDLRILEHDVCHNAYSQRATFDEASHICAGAVRGGVDTCNGDSGGPLMCQRCTNCAWFVAGITSFGDKNCGGAKTPGMYARVRSYEAWIRTQTSIPAQTAFTACR